MRSPGPGGGGGGGGGWFGAGGGGPAGAGAAAFYVDPPEPVYEAFPAPNAEWETGALRYEYESPVTPGSVYDYDIAAGTSTLLKRREVLGGFDPSRYGCERRGVAA